MPETLTPRQTRILDTLRASVEDRGYPPTLREIGSAVGLASSSSVAHQLKVIEKKGWIRRDPNSPRALTILDDEIERERLHVIADRGREWRDG